MAVLDWLFGSSEKKSAPVKKKRKTTKKGNARKGKPVGSRLAFDDVKPKKAKKKSTKTPAKVCKSVGKSLGKAGGHSRVAKKKNVKNVTSFVTRKTGTTKKSRSTAAKKLRNC
jgi:hypothetical protein